MKNLEEINGLYKKFEERYGKNYLNVPQGSDEWFYLKLGVLSASNIHKILPGRGGKYKLARQTYLYELVSQVCTGQHLDFSSAAMDWGTSCESGARASVEFFNDTTLTEVPFVFKDDSFREGASPDAIDEWGSGLEIKCPYNSANHIAFLCDDIIKPEYVAQVQYTMRVCDADCWMFTSYDPRMKKNPLAIKEVKVDLEYQKLLNDEVPKFINDMDEMLKKTGMKWGDQWLSK